jgi:surfeit locus 1 family protein
MAVAALLALLSLGTWQLDRKAWKDRILADIRSRVTAPPTSLDDVLSYMSATHPPDEPERHGEYSRVRLTGRFDHTRELFLYAPHSRLGPGVHVYTPFDLGGTGCRRFILVNRGFIPEALKDPHRRAAGQIGASGQPLTEVIGLLRYAERPGTFTPSNDPQRNVWYWRDISAMTKAAVPSATACPVPFSVDAEAEPANPGGWPRGGTTILNIPNRHWEYALTWFGLAATLVGVWLAFVLARLRQLAPDPPA